MKTTRLKQFAQYQNNQLILFVNNTLFLIFPNWEPDRLRLIVALGSEVTSKNVHWAYPELKWEKYQDLERKCVSFCFQDDLECKKGASLEASEQNARIV
jgi:hypothetical protein